MMQPQLPENVKYLLTKSCNDMNFQWLHFYYENERMMSIWAALPEQTISPAEACIGRDYVRDPLHVGCQIENKVKTSFLQ